MKQYIASLKDIIYKLHYLLTPRQRVLYIVVFVMSIIGALLESLGVSVILPLIEAITDPDALLDKTYIRVPYDLLGLNSPRQLIVLVIVGVIVIYVIKNLYLILLSYIRVSYSSSIQVSLGQRLMRSYMKRGYQYFLRQQSHVLYRGLTGDVTGVYALIQATFRLMAELLTVLSIGILVIFTDPFIALVVFMIGIFLILISTFITRNKIKRLGQDYRIYDTLMKTTAYEAFDGIKDILVMHRQQYFQDTYVNANAKSCEVSAKQTVTAESPTYLFEMVCVAGLMAGIGFRLSDMENAASFVPALATIAMAAFRIMPSLGRIANYMNNLMFNIPSFNACYDHVREADDYKVITEDEWPAEDVHKGEFTDMVEMRDITFRYDNTNVDVLHGLNLSFHKGESIGLIGESGAGKSTVSDMLLGLLIPQSGMVMMDGMDIRSIPNTWCRTIGYVPQTVYIMGESIRKNIAFGIPEDEIDDDKVWMALEEAQLKEFVETLPEELDTQLGERGVRFSGGQRQRVAIARALYYDPEILVLDEATSALDNKTEEAVMEAIDYLSGKKTMIIVAHRLTTVRNCNYIYEIKDGKAIRRTTDSVLAR